MKRITILILVILFSLSGLAESTTWFCPNDGSENNGNRTPMSILAMIAGTETYSGGLVWQ